MHEIIGSIHMPTDLFPAESPAFSPLFLVAVAAIFLLAAHGLWKRLKKNRGE